MKKDHDGARPSLHLSQLEAHLEDQLTIAAEHWDSGELRMPPDWAGYAIEDPAERRQAFLQQFLSNLVQSLGGTTSEGSVH